MRTTVDLPDELFRRVKSASAMKGLTLKSFVRAALERELKRQLSSGGGHGRAQLPLVRSASPASVKLTSDRAAQILEDEDLRVPR